MKRHLHLLASLAAALVTIAVAAPRILNGHSVPPPSAAHLSERPVAVVASQPSQLPASIPGHHTPVAASHYALTFDDGPHPVNTPAILDWLKENNIKAD